MDTVAVGDLSVGDAHPPRIMGVLNVSNESPYDPSVYENPDKAARYVETELVAEGADIVDVGLESANKRFETLSVDEELERLDVAADVIDRVDSEVVFSIETRYAAVADRALSIGFDMVNDVCGFADPDMTDVVEEHDASVVKMASPPDLERPGAVDDVDWADERSEAWAAEASYVDKLYASLERGGFTSKTLIDPAFGGWSASKTLDDDRETFRRLREFRALDRPILVSINRKNFLKDVVDRETADALPASLAATAMAVERGAHVIRTHDVAETRDAARIGRALRRDRVRSDRVEELDVTNERELARHVRRFDGSDARPTGSTIRATIVRDLSPSDRRRLRDIAEAAGLDVFGSERLLIIGSLAAYRRSIDRIDTTDDGLDEVGESFSRLLSNEKTYTIWGKTTN